MGFSTSSLDRLRQVVVASENGSEQNRDVFSHISLGVRDLDRAQAFYDAALEPLGFARLWRTAKGVGYGPPNPTGDEKLAPFLKTEADVPLAAGPGFHLALVAPTAEAVDLFTPLPWPAADAMTAALGFDLTTGKTYYAAFVSIRMVTSWRQSVRRALRG